VGETIKTVAVLAANPALSSILSMVLTGDRRLRVREFDSLRALTTYMGLTPVDLVVCDFDSETARADSVAKSLRENEGLVRRDFQIIALTRTISADTRDASISAGIDEVIVKPMSPRYLHERIMSRLRTPLASAVVTALYQGPERRDRLQSREPTYHPFNRYTDNVVNLFPNR
jgi:DNA-binding response OmpR family regulator